MATAIALVALFLMGWTYVGYPFWQKLFPGKQVQLNYPDQWPTVSVIFAAYNEREVIEQKIESIFNTNYPLDKVEVWIGSDKSNDGQDDLIKHLQKKYAALNLHINTERCGKSTTINSLVEKSNGSVLVATDANIIFQPNTLKELVAPTLQGYAATAGHLQYNSGSSHEEGTASHERTYLNAENAIKRAESRKYGFCLGMEGGIYAMRAEHWLPIPPNTYMEDFFQTMQLIQNGQRIYFNEKAVGLEDVSTSQGEEFKRKIRISIGNWQNLKRFWPLLFQRPYPLGFAFISHKILRWVTPHLYIIAVLFGGLISPWRLWFVPLIALPLSEWVIQKSIGPSERALSYFYNMNRALLIGFFKFLKGVESSVWQPTKRNQE